MPEEPATEAQPEAPAPAPRRRARIKVADVKIDRPYGELQRFSTQPTLEQIAKAIEEGRLDERINAGEHQLAMYEDCKAAGKGDLGEIMRLIQEYHAQRIAYFVVNGWDEENDRLALDHQGNLRDGGHRYWAAAYLGKEEVFVEYQPAPERPPAVQG